MLSSGAMRLPKQLRQVAIYLAHNTRDIALGTVVEIAQNARVQPSALVRFAQSLGFPGFSDLQEIFKDYVKINWPETRERDAGAAPAAMGDPDFRIVAGLIKASVASLTRLPEKIDLPTFTQVANLMAEAETIYRQLFLRRSAWRSRRRSSNVGEQSCRQCRPDEIGFASTREVAFAISFSPW